MNLASRLEDVLPDGIFSLLRLVAEEATRRGLRIYAVGGLPRDLLLQRLTRDLDLVLESDAVSFARALSRTHGGRVTVHPSFFTATWHLPPNLIRQTDYSSSFIDFISARSETYKHPAALPTVTLGTLTDDLERRDFTINAMAIRLDGNHFGTLLDPLDGRSDLRRGRVRVLHTRSFVDDPTRLFRAVRYAGRYGFKIASDTASLVPGALKYVDRLTPERLRHELDLILDEENAVTIIDHLAGVGLLSAVKPALPEFDPNYASCLTRRPPVALSLQVEPRMLGYLLWLMDLPEAAIVSLAARLDFTAELTKSLRAASRLKADLPDLEGARPSVWTERLDKVPPLAVYAVHLGTRQSALKTYLFKWRHIRSSITGDDLKARGLPPGPEFKRILSRLRAAWLDGEVENVREEKKLLNNLLTH